MVPLFALLECFHSHQGTALGGGYPTGVRLPHPVVCRFRIGVDGSLFSYIPCPRRRGMNFIVKLF